MNHNFQSNPVKTYNQLGFAIVNVFNESEYETIKNYAKEWVYSLLKLRIQHRDEFPLSKYHKWGDQLKVDHSEIFQAKNRFIFPPKYIKKIIINDKIQSFLHAIGLDHFEVWDDGKGWFGFRYIRPGRNDGYPLSRKEWGPAKKVISCWIPIIGFDPNETLTLVPGSHLKEYEKYLPNNNKFTPEEFRFKGDIKCLKRYNPKLQKGEVVFFNPKTLHSEDVEKSSITRLNLEVRFNKKE